MTGLRRRQALCLLGSGLALLAGCSDSSGDESDDGDGQATEEDGESDDSDGGGGETTAEADEETDERQIESESIDAGELPVYASHLADVGADSYVVGAVDFSTMDRLVDDSGDDADAGGDEPTDPLLVNPLTIALFGYFAFAAIVDAEYRSTFGGNDRTPEDEGHVLIAQQTNLFLGSFDFEGLLSGFREFDYDEITAGDDRAVFYDESTSQAIGFTPDLFAFAYESADGDVDPVERVSAFVAVDRGDAPPKHETSEAVEFLLRAGEASGVSLLLVSEDGIDPDEPLLETETDGEDYPFHEAPFAGAVGAQQHLDASDRERSTASAVVTYPDEERIDEPTLLEELGTEAESASFRRDGASVAVEAEYAADELEDDSSE